jgi:transketolase
MNKLNGDVRDIFFNNIKKIFIKNNKNYILTNDSDVFALKSLRNNQRFIDAGVAEQNLINISAGLAKFAKLPLVYGFCSFLTFRCYEQLRFNIASHNLNVKIIGIGPGFSFPYDGPTHHGTQDIYLMYLIPEFEIYNISDNNLANEVSKKINKIKGPTYIRIDKGNLNYNQNIKYNLDKGYEIIFKSKKQNILIITSGIFCKYATELASSNNSDVSVLNLFKFKNFNKKGFIKIIKQYKKIIIYDESSESGGILPIINNCLVKNKVNKKIEILTSPDKQIFNYYQDRDLMISKSGLGKKNLNKLL